MKSRKKSKKLELRMVFDTNVLYTGSASDLVRQEVADLIKECAQYQDLSLRFFLPEIVRHERQFQMFNKSLDLLPSVRKLERLLGHNLNITDEILEQRVQDTIERQIKELGLQILTLNTSEVDWNQVILDAAYRRPPFEQGEKEKGFRDAVIAESFLQLVSSSPTTPNVCRIVLITGDNLLTQAIKKRTESVKNIRILQSVEELKGLINTLASTVSEEFVASIQDRAQAYFFTVGQKESLYYKEGLTERIRAKFDNELRRIPQKADTRENGTWSIHPARFVKKERQRVFWVNRISVEAKAYKYTEGEKAQVVPSSFGGPTDLDLQLQASPSINLGDISRSVWTPQVEGKFIFPGSTQFGPKLKAGSSGQYLISEPSSPDNWLYLPTINREKTLVANGKTVFDVIWSVAVSTTGKFSNPRIELIEHVETLWE
jgi:hypothetical protein